MPPKSSTRSQSIIKLLFALVSGTIFLGSTVLLLFRLIQSPPPVPTNTETTPVVEQLQAEEKGYLLVLEREPDNPTALQGLVDVRLALNDLEGAIAPLEKLIALYPQEEGLKMLLDTIQQQVAAQKQKQP